MDTLCLYMVTLLISVGTLCLEVGTFKFRHICRSPSEENTEIYCPVETLKEELIFTNVR